MLKYFVRPSASEDVQEVKTAPKEQAWVYSSHSNEKDLQHIIKEYNLDENIVRDVYDKYELPRVEYKSNVMYVFLRVPFRSRSGNVASVPVLCVVKGSILITLSVGDYFVPADVFSSSKLTMKNSKHVFVQILAYVADQYEEHIQRTGAYIVSTGKRLQTRDVDNHDFINFVTVESDLNEFNTSLSAVLAVLERLSENKFGAFNDKDVELIKDIILFNNQLLVAISSHAKTIQSIRNAYTTISNNSLNKRMKTLTILTVLITMPNVFYGMYGMNVALPFAHEPWAFAAITGFTALLVIIGYGIVRRKKF